MNKHVLMVISMMKGGGAERVAAQLMNEFHKKGNKVEFVLTSCKESEVKRTDLDENIPLMLLQDTEYSESCFEKLKSKALRLYSSFFCKIFEALKLHVPAHFAYCSFIAQYRKEIQQLRGLMKKDPNMTVVSFLQPSVPMVLLAARGLPNKIIISERENPKRLMKRRYGKYFVEKYYTRADKVVFQTQDAMATYPDNVNIKGTVIPNPIKGDLPLPYVGERNKVISTFCRISIHKNLPMLIKAFAMLHEEHPEYILKIVGDANNAEDQEVKRKLHELVGALKLRDYVIWKPFNANVHEDVMYDAMYVNSSDTEGMSNAMLEAMAIGMPVICTDCPIGGARATINHEENGILVPVGDEVTLYHAMKKVVEDGQFAIRLSEEAALIRDRLSIENISRQWLEML